MENKTLCQTICFDYEREVEQTRRMLERVNLETPGLSDYRPHPKSMTLNRLATHIADLPGWPAFMLESEEFVLPENFQPEVSASSRALMEKFEACVERGRKAIANATDEDMKKTWTFRYKDYSSSGARPDVVRSTINHMVHHRAQLGLYLRLNDVAIPGMYGPSADEAF
ncbi:hypothetical protein F183_A10290 [Bryobacterales bacterium F-183]|nr:hypothetical protein F183_A10290 [Bryobacterales bacterium F-183]